MHNPQHCVHYQGGSINFDVLMTYCGSDIQIIRGDERTLLTLAIQQVKQELTKNATLHFIQVQKDILAHLMLKARNTELKMQKLKFGNNLLFPVAHMLPLSKLNDN